MMSAYDNPSYVASAAAFGAYDFLLKDVLKEELLKTIQRAAKGEPLPKESRLEKVREILSRKRPVSFEIAKKLVNTSRKYIG